MDERDRSDMARLTAGHDAALHDLMGRHSEKLFHYLIRCLQNEEDAADTAQETFVRVYQHRAKFEASQRFSTSRRTCQKTNQRRANPWKQPNVRRQFARR